MLIHEDGSIFFNISVEIENVPLCPSFKHHCVEKHLTMNTYHKDRNLIKCMCGSIGNVPYTQLIEKHCVESIFQITVLCKNI